jgi:hypothetical protein
MCKCFLMHRTCRAMHEETFTHYTNVVLFWAVKCAEHILRWSFTVYKLKLKIDVCRSCPALISHIWSPVFVRPFLELVDPVCFNHILREPIPLIHSSHTKPVLKVVGILVAFSIKYLTLSQVDSHQCCTYYDNQHDVDCTSVLCHYYPWGILEKPAILVPAV